MTASKFEKLRVPCEKFDMFQPLRSTMHVKPSLPVSSARRARASSTKTAKNTSLHGKRYERVIRSEDALRLREGSGRGRLVEHPHNPNKTSFVRVKNRYLEKAISSIEKLLTNLILIMCL